MYSLRSAIITKYILRHPEFPNKHFIVQTDAHWQSSQNKRTPYKPLWRDWRDWRVHGEENARFGRLHDLLGCRYSLCRETHLAVLALNSFLCLVGHRHTPGISLRARFCVVVLPMKNCARSSRYARRDENKDLNPPQTRLSFWSLHKNQDTCIMPALISITLLLLLFHAQRQAFLLPT